MLDHHAFRDGDLHTGFVAEHKSDLGPVPLDETELVQLLAAAALGFRDFQDLALRTPEPYSAIGGWRN